MSLILNQPSKLCFRKPVLVRSSPVHSKGFSPSSLPEQSQTLPIAIICADPCRPHLATLVVRKDGDMSPCERKLPMDAMERMGMIGSFNGWGAATMVDDEVMSLLEPYLEALPLDTLELLSSPLETLPVDNLKLNSWPPLETLPLCQTQMVTNVAMSSSSPDEEDCVVALKFLGPQLSLCRPAQSNSEWINIRISNPCFFSSRVMYSEKDDMFRLVGSGGHLIGSWDLRKHKHTPKIQELQFQCLPELSKAKRELLYSSYTSEHLVESRTTGETFMVKWYKRTTKTMDGIDRMETKALMVFKLDEEGNTVYTQDIGDLCIYLTRSETYCVPACSVPAMRPNHVKIIDVDETTIVDLAAQKWN